MFQLSLFRFLNFCGLICRKTYLPEKVKSENIPIQSMLSEELPIKRHNILSYFFTQERAR